MKLCGSCHAHMHALVVDATLSMRRARSAMDISSSYRSTPQRSLTARLPGLFHSMSASASAPPPTTTSMPSTHASGIVMQLQIVQDKLREMQWEVSEENT